MSYPPVPRISGVATLPRALQRVLLRGQSVYHLDGKVTIKQKLMCLSPSLEAPAFPFYFSLRKSYVIASPIVSLKPFLRRPTPFF